MSEHILELTLSSQPDFPVKIRYNSGLPGRQLWLVGVKGGSLAFDLWQVGLRHTELINVDTKADFVNGLIAEYPQAGERQQELGHVLEHWTWIRIEQAGNPLIPGRLVIIDEDRNQLFSDRILVESLLAS
jgi:hypothetical protein